MNIRHLFLVLLLGVFTNSASGESYIEAWQKRGLGKINTDITCAIDAGDAPFVYKNQKGAITGYSIELLEKISKDVGLNCNYIVVENTSAQIEAVKNNKADLAIGSISITSGREKSIDYTHGFFSTQIAALVKESQVSISYTLWRIAKDLICIIFLFVVGLYIIGTISYLLERRHEESKTHSLHGWVWWALVTFATVGYGDMVPKTPLGKFFGSIWIIVSMSALAVYTGYISSVFVADKIESSVEVKDLYDRRVVSVIGTTSQEFLEERNIKANYLPNLNEALKAFTERKADVIVYDAALLEYIIKKNPDAGLTAYNLDSEIEQYSIVLQQGSDWRERINISLLSNLKSEWAKELKSKYFN